MGESDDDPFSSKLMSFEVRSIRLVGSFGDVSPAVVKKQNFSACDVNFIASRHVLDKPLLCSLKFFRHDWHDVGVIATNVHEVMHSSSQVQLFSPPSYLNFTKRCVNHAPLKNGA